MKKYFAISGLVAVVFLFTLIAYSFNWFATIENKFDDRLFLKRSPQSQIVIIAVDDESISKIGHWPWPRKTFARILPQLNTAKAVGFDINFSETSSVGQEDDNVLAQAMADSKSKIVLPIQLRADGEVSVKPLSIFASHAQIGFVNVPVSSGDAVRTINNSIGKYKSFSAVLFGKDTPNVNRINYAGPAKTILTVPFIDLYENKIPATLLNNTTVLIGATANDLHDFLDTPFGLLPGVEVHANAIETLETGKTLNEVSFAIGTLIILLTVIISGWVVFWFKKLPYIIGALIGILVIILAASFGTFQQGVILPVAYIILGFMLSAASTLIYQYVTESKEKRFIQKTFQYYLMPEVINEIMKNPGKLVLGGEKKRLTILFSDIRGFTSLSEKLTPEALVHNINQYFTLMSDSIMENKGLVDKYIGDAIMAFWGAPISNEHQACDACLAALAMSAHLKGLNEKWKASGVPEIGIGIGLNTGDVIVGNMGSEKRFNYTIMGDEVNFGSRLEGLNKAYGTECIISEETKDAVEHDSRFVIRELDNVMVKGKKEPKLIFELVTHKVDDEFKKILKLFSGGLTLYKEGDFKEALTIFQKALEIGPDGPSQAFVERCHYLIEHPPETWNGVYEFKTK